MVSEDVVEETRGAGPGHLPLTGGDGAVKKGETSRSCPRCRISLELRGYSIPPVNRRPHIPGRVQGDFILRCPACGLKVLVPDLPVDKAL